MTPPERINMDLGNFASRKDDFFGKYIPLPKQKMYFGNKEQQIEK